MRLWLLRHAKSSWENTGLPDEERPLASRGQGAADRMRDYLAAESIEPELVLCSSATRARETLARVLPGLGSELQVLIEPELYTFDADVLLHRLFRVPGEIGSVMLVGHNPAIEELAVRIADRGDRLRDLSKKYPTAALAEITFPAKTWTSIEERPGALTRFVVPKDLT
jgi:phosphohistidine phosphatase